MLISPTEPYKIKEVGTVSSIPERNGCDMMIIKRGKRTGIQRKEFPSDLLASLSDGRLYKQLHQMEALDRAMLVIEGYGRWTSDGELMDIRAFNKAQLHGLIFTCAFEFGVEVFQVRDMGQTIELLNHLDVWAGKKSHTSMRRRPGPAKDSWGKLGNKSYALHFLQSFPDVGPELAERIIEHFGRVPVRWEIEGPEDLMLVKGIGKIKAQKIWEVLK